MPLWKSSHHRPQSLSGFRHDKQRIAARKRWTVYFLFFLLIIILLRTPLSGVLSSSLHRILSPFWTAESSLSLWLKDATELFTAKQLLIIENDRLKDALDAVLVQALSRGELEDENAHLKAALGRTDKRDLLLARVLATPGRSTYDTLVLDVGKDHGLVTGMRILTDGDFVIGEVSQVMEGSAVVTLYSSSGKETPVNIGTSSLPALMRGEGGGNFRITLPRGTSVSPGNLVKVPAFAASYGGVIEAIELKEGGSLEDLYVKWPFNMHTLTWVYVVISEKSGTR